MTDTGYTRYCVYAADGTIIRTGTVTADSVSIQAVHVGEAAIPCSQDVRSGTHKVDISGKTPVAIVMSDQEVAAKIATLQSVAAAALQAENAAIAAEQLNLNLTPVGP